MLIAVTGTTGLVGGALCPFLASQSYKIRKLVRKSTGASDEKVWDPYAEKLDAAVLEGADAVVHLAGENIAGRWSKKKKAAIRESRVKSACLLAETMAKMSTPPRTFVCASAIGFYGERGEQMVNEESTVGSGFLPELCKAWEDACKPASIAGIRVVNLRIGVIMSSKGGALAKMLTPFKLCLGGVVGSGKQYWSWIALDDILGAIQHVLATPALKGPVNLVSPNACDNRSFTKTLGKVLHRPTIFPLPAFVAKLVLGEMAEGLLLMSTRVEPRRLLESGYPFRHAELESALKSTLGK